MSTEALQEQQKSWIQTPPSNPPLRHALARVAEEQTWLDRLAKPLQNWVLQLFGQPGEPGQLYETRSVFGKLVLAPE